MQAAATLIGAVLLGMATAGTGQAGERDGGQAALLEADREFGRQTAARGLAGWLDFFAEDAVIFPEGGPIVRGLAAIRAHYDRTGFDPTALRWTPLAGDIAAAGDLGTTYGTWEVRRMDASGRVVVHTGKYFTSWRKQPDGRWKVVADIGNADPPASPAAP